MCSWLILIGRGFNHNNDYLKRYKVFCYSVLRDYSHDLVILAKWSHLFPSRTQKLSTLAATISSPALVKIAHCQLIRTFIRMSFFCVLWPDDREIEIKGVKGCRIKDDTQGPGKGAMQKVKPPEIKAILSTLRQDWMVGNRLWLQSKGWEWGKDSREKRIKTG